MSGSPETDPREPSVVDVPGGGRDLVLVVAPAGPRRAMLCALVERLGWEPRPAGSAQEAVWELSPAPPHLVLIDVVDPASAGWVLDLVEVIRARGEMIPITVLLARRSRSFTVAAFGRRVDDVVVGPLHDEELAARLEVRMERLPILRGDVLEDPTTGALTPEALGDQIEHELSRVRRGGRPGTLAFLTFDELPEIEARLGSRARQDVITQVVQLIKDDGREVDYVGYRRGVLVLLMPATSAKGAEVRLNRLIRLLAGRTLLAGGQASRLTPIVGYAASEGGVGAEALEEHAWTAMMHQAEQLDLHPTRWRPELSGEQPRGSFLLRWLGRARTPVQVVAQQLACLVLPFVIYLGLMHVGIDVTGVVYLFVVCALAATAATIWAEGLAALRVAAPPEPSGAFPKATAIIAAYLPNEAPTIVETVEAMLRQDYPDLQVILAYNTPRELPIEDDLREIARRDPRFEPLRVEGSASKAQNVNAALSRVAGEIVGLFDADHHPEPGAFRRAWQWLSNGYDVVQGHCVVRNGDETRITRLVAAEFETIYAVSHPGRARLHGFGIFGGSNGYWHTEVLRQMRMRGFMLTEDIDSSMRVIESGGKIRSDPGLVSTELAPDTYKALWNQRMRWAQGWSQVSLRHVRPMWRRPGAGPRGRFGAVQLLAWRELYPWLSLQMLPVLAVWLFRGEPAIDWFVPVFVVTTLFTISAGPVQVLIAWHLAHPSVGRHARWFLFFLVVSALVYTEWKNVIVRTAHLKELMGERTWKVTPRSTRSLLEGLPHGVERRSPNSVGVPLRGEHPVGLLDVAIAEAGAEDRAA